MTSAAQEEQLRQVLGQLQMQHNAAVRSLGVVRAQAEAKERQRRIAELSLGQVESACSTEEPEMWTGVGKMFIRTSGKEATANLRGELKSATEDVEALKKKAKVRRLFGLRLRPQYLENEIIGAERNLREILHGSRRND